MAKPETMSVFLSFFYKGCSYSITVSYTVPFQCIFFCFFSIISKADRFEDLYV